MSDFAPLSDYALIGDGRVAALVSRRGAIDWVGWAGERRGGAVARERRGEPIAIFDAVRTPERASVRGGTFRIAPAEPSLVRRRYLPGTNVLETRFRTGRGALVVLDAMTAPSDDERGSLFTPEHELVREVRCEQGEALVDVVYDPRPPDARREAPLDDAGKLGLRLALPRGGVAVLRTDAPLFAADHGAETRVRMRRGQRFSFVLTWAFEGPAVLSPLGEPVHAALVRTAAAWRAWSERARAEGVWRDAVVRSLLAARLLGAFEEHGATSHDDAARALRALAHLGYGSGEAARAPSARRVSCAPRSPAALLRWLRSARRPAWPDDDSLPDAPSIARAFHLAERLAGATPDDARARFAAALGRASDLGLFAEDMASLVAGVREGARPPLAHLALLGAATALDAVDAAAKHPSGARPVRALSEPPRRARRLSLPEDVNGGRS